MGGIYLGLVLFRMACAGDCHIWNCRSIFCFTLCASDRGGVVSGVEKYCLSYIQIAMCIFQVNQCSDWPERELVSMFYFSKFVLKKCTPHSRYFSDELGVQNTENRCLRMDWMTNVKKC